MVGGSELLLELDRFLVRPRACRLETNGQARSNRPYYAELLLELQPCMLRSSPNWN